MKGAVVVEAERWSKAVVVAAKMVGATGIAEQKGLMAGSMLLLPPLRETSLGEHEDGLQQQAAAWERSQAWTWRARARLLCAGAAKPVVAQQAERE